MNEIILIILFLIIGISAGVFAGMLGIGGGIIFVPALYLLLPYTHVDPNQIIFIVIGTSLFSSSIAAFSSGSNHIRAKNVDKKKAFFLAAGSGTASFLTAFFVVKINSDYLHLIFAIVFILIALKMLFENKKSNRTEETELFSNKYFLIIIGVCAGIISSFVGIGGGVIFVPVLFYLYGLKIKKAIGTSSVVTAVTTFSAAVSYLLQPVSGVTADLQIGYVYLPAGISLGIGSFFGAYWGVKFVLKSSGSLIKKIFSLLLIITVIKILLEYIHF